MYFFNELWVTNHMTICFEINKNFKTTLFSVHKMAKNRENKTGHCGRFESQCPALGIVSFCKETVYQTGGIGFLDPTFSGSGGPMMSSPPSRLLRPPDLGFCLSFYFYFLPPFFHKDFSTRSLSAELSKSDVFLRIL